MPETTYDKIRKQECEWCAMNMPFVSAIRKIGSPAIHEVSSPASRSPDYKPCTAPTRDQVIDRLTSALERARGAIRQEICSDNCPDTCCGHLRRALDSKEQVKTNAE